MKIAQIAPINLPIPTKYGGVERIITDLTYGLRQKKHDITVYASGDSKIEGKKSFINKHISGDYMKVSKITLTHLTHLSLSFNHAEKISDIIHCHIAYLPFFYTPFISKPILITMHNPIKYTEHKEILDKFKYKYLISISKNQQKNTPGVYFFSNIYNGVDTKIFNFPEDEVKKEDFLWVGRFSKIKGPDLAIKSINKIKGKLILIGPKSLGDTNFYEKKIKPFINSKNIIYKGEKNKNDLVKYYQNAKALLFPIQWEEPFGLVMIEAMACGTPVIAFKRGSVPEIIKDGETGYVVNPAEGVHGYVKAIKKLNSLSKVDYKKMCSNCRKHVEENFTVEKMVDNYEKVYQKVIDDWKEKHKK